MAAAREAMKAGFMSLKTEKCQNCGQSGVRAKGYRPSVNGTQPFYCEAVDCQLAGKEARWSAELGPTLWQRFVERLCGRQANPTEQAA